MTSETRHEDLGLSPSDAANQVYEPELAQTQELVAVSRRYGADPAFSRAGGGNSSVKAGGVLWIKPSGVPLATLEATDLVPLDRATLLALLDSDNDPSTPAGDPVVAAAAEARLGEARGRRPSVELLFHALLPERLVLHTHPIVVNALTCSADGVSLAARLLGDRAVWVPYTDPGLPLAHAIRDARRAHEDRTGGPAPAITLLANHGLIVAGETADDIDAETEWLVGVIESELQRDPVHGKTDAASDDEGRSEVVNAVAPVLRAVLAGNGRRGTMVFDDHPLAREFTATSAGRAFVTGGPLIPDQIVYTGSWPLLLELDEMEREDLVPYLREQLRAHEARTGTLPIVTVVPGVGLFAAGDTWSQADTARLIYLDMLRVADGATRLGGVRALGDSGRTFIEQWEAEAYRKQIAAGDGSGGRLAESGLNAPIYAPAPRYQEPTLLPGQLRSDSVTIGELLEAPATRSILLSEPVLAALLPDPPFRHHLYNLTLTHLAGIVSTLTPDVLRRLEADLQALPPDLWPNL